VTVVNIADALEIVQQVIDQIAPVILAASVAGTRFVECAK
jgi:hypothetical protein